MNIFTLKNNRRIAKVAAAASLAFGLTVAGVTLGASKAIARATITPIDITPRTTITPGTPLACNVKLSDAGNITIYSNPPGVVSYSGYANATDTVNATTSTSASGSVTIYLKTDGSTVVSALATAPTSNNY